MVRAVENWADLTGTVRAIGARPGVPGMSEVVLAVEEARDVEGYPNLLTEAPGEELVVSADTADLDDLEPGARVCLRAQRADPRTVVAAPESSLRL